MRPSRAAARAVLAAAIVFAAAVPLQADDATVPAHVQTFLFWGVNGTPRGEPQIGNREAAKWVTWGMSEPHESRALADAGISMVYYTNPNRVFKKSKFFRNDDESVFAHDCKGRRITVRGRSNQFLTNPGSVTTALAWRADTADGAAHGNFAAIFDDTAGSTGLISALPCGFAENDWLLENLALIMSLDRQVLFNGLGDGMLPVSGRRGPDADYGLSPVIALAAAPNAIGGSFEDCYVSPDPDNGFGKTANAYWRMTEETELAMARLGKIFVCNERVDRMPMDGAADMRTYAEASLLLTFDLDSTVVRQQFQTPSWFNLGPEVELVPTAPVIPSPASLDALRSPGGAYGRAYERCYIAGTPVGRCAAAVNPDSHAAHPFPFAGYGHTMTLDGGGIVDGGEIGFSGPPPPAVLPPLTGVVAFQ